MDRVINTPLPLKGSEKQIAWAENIRKKAMDFVRENQDAIDVLARKKNAARFLLITMGCTDSSKVWIENFRNGVKTVEEAVSLTNDSKAFCEPKSKWLKMKLATSERMYRMEAAKERMRDGFVC